MGKMLLKGRKLFRPACEFAAERKMKLANSDSKKNLVITSGVILPARCQFKRIREGAVQMTFARVSLPI